MSSYYTAALLSSENPTLLYLILPYPTLPLLIIAHGPSVLVLGDSGRAQPLLYCPNDEQESQKCAVFTDEKLITKYLQPYFFKYQLISATEKRTCNMRPLQ